MFETIVSIILAGTVMAIAYIIYHIQDMEGYLDKLVASTFSRLTALEKKNEE